MANVACTFYITESAIGGKLTGGFVNGSVLNSGDNLVVSVVYPTQGASPQTLTGVFVFTAAPAASSNQATPSPFVVGSSNNFVCVTSVPSAAGVTGTNAVTYNFPAVPYAGGSPGSYELTFVAIDGDLQWSEDPEFDTSS